MSSFIEGWLNRKYDLREGIITLYHLMFDDKARGYRVA